MQAQNRNNADPMRPLPFRISGAREEIPGCRTVTVEPLDGIAAYFAPGQFYMLYAFGHGEVPISASGRLTFTIMSVGSVTAALHNLEKGAVIGLRGPFGSSWPMDRAAGQDVIIMAGGLGLAPLRPVIHEILSDRKSFGNVSLLYGARRPATILFRDEMEAWRAKGIDVQVAVDSAGREWRGHVGVVTDLATGLRFVPGRTLAMICGPEIMMRFSVQALLDAGLKAADVYISMERNMKCAIARCGRCQYGPYFICKDGPVFPFNHVDRLFRVREV